MQQFNILINLIMQICDKIPLCVLPIFICIPCKMVKLEVMFGRYGDENWGDDEFYDESKESGNMVNNVVKRWWK